MTDSESMEQTAYNLPPPRIREDLTLVDKGTAMGEFLRRYWHPVGTADHATETPRKVMVLGEELILFRDGQGRPGLLYPRCCHRGTTLYYGRVEEDGIRCCYHGWKFAPDGRCLDQPMEVDGGRNRDKVRQPFYPVEERYGLIFAYLGPPEKKPLLPRFELLEGLDDGEFIEADDTSVGSGGPVEVPCNWMQHYENIMDPFHVPVLHGWFSGGQFVPEMAVLPDVEFLPFEMGMRSVSIRQLDDGRTLRRITEALLPTVRVVPSPRLDPPGRCSTLGWILPMTSTSFRIYTAGRVRESGEIRRSRSKQGGKLWEELTDAEHQRYPGDYEAQVGQGEITYHSEEHFGETDKGIGMLRRFVAQQVRHVADGGDPVGVAFEPGQEVIRSEAGNFFI